MGSKKSIVQILIISLILLIAFHFTFIQYSQAEDLFADLEITVDNSGFVSINGNTNYANLIVENSQNYTSKNKDIWTLNITTKASFSDYVYSITLPEQAQIKSLTSSGSTLISESSGYLVINGYGSKEPISVIVEYQTNKITEFNEVLGFDLFSIFLIICIIVLIISFFIVLFFFEKKEKPSYCNKKELTPELKLKGLNDRQKKIMILLQESDIALTQTDIQKELNMPKASVSRNIRRLELKGLIEKEKIGMSNIIRLKKQ